VSVGLFSPRRLDSPPLRHRLGLFLLLLALAVWAVSPSALAQVASDAAGQAADSQAPSASETAHSGGWGPTVAKVANFLVLIGALAYLLKGSVIAHLAARQATIGRALVEAQSLREHAEDQLASIRARLRELPVELRTLQARGLEELARERERLEQATVIERDKLVARTRKEIDLQFRVARRDLIEHAADLAMGLARNKIEQQVTLDDHLRLIDRYATEVRS
jgi:F-type H+-transporting ATPase subunit b